jgi:thiol:disulfide interchange protein/DsbC/DsbD-like thiol-disulfide interchange protein
MPTLGCRLLPLLAAALLAAAWPATVSPLRASDAIPNEPTTGRSATVTQPHVTAELIVENPTYDGRPFDVVLHLHMDSGWHTYWINPGDAGLATDIKWTLPPGWIAGPLRFPTPEVHMMGPLTTYGYAGDVYLPTTITPGAAGSGDVSINAHSTWLVCKEECIPGKGDFVLPVKYQPLHPPSSGPSGANFALGVNLRLPMRSNVGWTATASYSASRIDFVFKAPAGQPFPSGTLSFFAEQPNVLDTKSNQLQVDGGTGTTELHAHLDLIQNGEKPDHMSGVLVGEQSLVGLESRILVADTHAASIPPFPVTDGSAPIGSASSSDSNAPPSGASPAAAPPPNSTQPAPATASAIPPSAPFLPAILAAAFVGGLILNLMPCVLPVLSLKVFSLIRHAGEDAGGAWKQGLAFAAGVLISFWILAGLLIALESAGQHLGWGFQMQSPGFVLALIFLFFLLGLNLFGVFELGTSLVGLDVKATSGLGGLASSFGNGALATLAATPCTAPFMGSAVGFAAQQPAAISLLVFTALALGMAAPYLALTAFPGALRLVPKPGAWMETLKQFMGFLLMGTVIFLVYVFGALTNEDSVPMLLGSLLAAAVAAWVFGRIRLANQAPSATSAMAKDGWQPWTPAAVQAALTKGQPVFVDFTAAWCLSCKVNERLALDIDSTRKLFADKHVALFRGDWTHSDPQISDTLRQFNRDGVPLYLVYSPRNPNAPQVLPEVLTPGLVQDALQKLP